MGSVGVIISTLLIKFYGWTGFDPIASLFIAVLIVASVVPLVIDTGKILCLDVSSRSSRIDGAMAEVRTRVPCLSSTCSESNTGLGCPWRGIVRARTVLAKGRQQPGGLARHPAGARAGQCRPDWAARERQVDVRVRRSRRRPSRRGVASAYQRPRGAHYPGRRRLKGSHPYVSVTYVLID
jgi:hypothetical protein